MQKKKPDVFITLRREQFEELERALLAVLRDGPYADGGYWCRGCSSWATDHLPACPIYLISKLEKV